MEVTKETITHNPFNYCISTDVGREFLIWIELVTPTSFNIAITEGSNVDLTGTGNIRGSDYRFTAEGTEIDDGNSFPVKMEGTMRLKSEALAEGRATYEYREGRGGTVLCRGEDEFYGSRTVAFADPNIEAVVRDKIGKQWSEILPSDLARVTGLDAADRGISNLRGIEQLTRLTSLA